MPAASEGRSFSEDLASKLSGLCRTLVAEYEDSLSELHATECSRIRNSFVEQELQLRAEIASLQERNAKLSEKVDGMTTQMSLRVAGRAEATGDALGWTPPTCQITEAAPPDADSAKRRVSWADKEHQAQDAPAQVPSIEEILPGAVLPGAVGTGYASEGGGHEEEPLPPTRSAPTLPMALNQEELAEANPARRGSDEQGQTASEGGVTFSDTRRTADSQCDAVLKSTMQSSAGKLCQQTQHGENLGKTASSRRTRNLGFKFEGFQSWTLPGKNVREAVSELVASEGSEQDFARLGSRFMMHPNSRVSTVKDVLSVLCLIWDGMTLPFILAWEPEPTYVMTTISVLLLLFWTGEMFITMNTGFYRNGVLEMRRKKAFIHYVKRWFFIDLLTVSTDWVNCFLDLLSTEDETQEGIELIRLIKLNRLMRLVRAFRVMKVYDHLKNIGHNLSGIYLTGSWSMLFKISQYVVYIFVLNHVVACMWFAIGKHAPAAGASDTGLGWLEAYNIVVDGDAVKYEDLTITFQYLTCLHFAVSNTVLGSLSIDPVNSLERGFTVCCLVVGFVIASILVSSLSSWLVQTQMMKQEKVTTMATLRRFLRENAVTTSLANRIDQHVLARISINPRLKEEQVDALDMLTPALRGELRDDMYSRFVLTNPMLRTWDGLDSKVMEAICVTAIVPTYLEVGAELFSPNSKAEHAFVISAGTMGYVQSTRGKVFKRAMRKRRPGELENAFEELDDNTHRVLHPLDWLAEAILWVPWTFQGTATAQSECELLCVTPDGISKVVSKRPHLMQMMSDYRHAFMEKLSALDHASLTDVGACIPHRELVMSVHSQSRVLLGVPALRMLKQRYAFRALVGDSLDRLEDEIAHGERVLTMDGHGTIERVARTVALRVRRPDGRVLMQLGRQKTGFTDKEPRLPTVILHSQEPEEGLGSLLSGDLAAVAAALTFGACNTVVTTSTSRTYASISLRNVYINMVYSAAISSDVELPNKCDVASAVEHLKNLEAFNTADIQALHEVHMLRGGDDEEICCAWLMPTGSSEDVVMKNAGHSKRDRPSVTLTVTPAKARRKSVVKVSKVDQDHTNPRSGDSVQSFSIASRRLPFPKLLHNKALPNPPPKTGVPLLRSLLKDRKTDWHRARRAATWICEPDYSCEDFFRDCIAAFPELGLYVVGANPSYSTEQTNVLQATTGGRTTDDEYQRTMCAFFSFFWLMRLGLEGPDSFSYGLNEAWQPRLPNPDPDMQTDEVKRRMAFRQNADWDAMHQLLEDAGIAKRTTGVASESQHDPERTLAMLSLTAYHDIMKVQALLPTVEDRHGSWCGFKAGEVIDDHDAALGYILEHYPDLLPSFMGLPPAAQRSIRFTQCKMEYNMGWLVQAEAPPGALLSTLRRTVQSGNASQQDIAFYFVHWFTDLAGAVPTPLGGSEKFVLGFPLKVLSSFLSSFTIVGDLGNLQSETQVCENYLRWRWETHKPALGPPPSGMGSIAKMRLVLMAQGNSKHVLQAYGKLPEEDRSTLSKELARTGCEGQRYSTDTLEDTRGPAILVYYGPAFLQKAGLLDPVGAMQVLAELLRQARAMWPLKRNLSGVSVTVRIDALKAETVQACRRPPLNQAWILEKVSERSASVSLVELPKVGSNGDDGINWSERCILNFGAGLPVMPASGLGGAAED